MGLPTWGRGGEGKETTELDCLWFIQEGGRGKGACTCTGVWYIYKEEGGGERGACTCTGVWYISIFKKLHQQGYLLSEIATPTNKTSNHC